MLYGGIDSKEVTERATDPSGAMGAIQRILANDVACKQTALDFSRPPAERRLFPGYRAGRVPGASPEADAKIRKAIVHLHQRVLGRYDAPDSPEVDRTYSSSPASSPTPPSAKGMTRKRTTFAARDCRSRPRPEIHGSRVACRGHVSAPPARIPLRVDEKTMRRDFLKLCGLVGLGFECPGGVSSLLGARPRKSRLTTGLLHRLQRLRRLGHDLSDGPQGHRRHQPPLQGRRHPHQGAAQVRPHREAHPRPG